MSRLFDLGSHVAKPRLHQTTINKDNNDSRATFEPNGIGDGFSAEHIDDLETWINEMTEELPELTSFILPTGALGAAQLHVARTVCRRAERRLVPLVVEKETCDPNAFRYLNRLSDFFFVAARWVNLCEGHEEIEYRRQSTETKRRERVPRTLR
jgi:cob(I)alamin adenosyltransferase